MSVADTDPLVQYNKGAGWTGPYTIPFKYIDTSHIVAKLSFDDAGVTADMTLIENTDYTISTPGATGTLTVVTAWAAAAVRLTIYRTVPRFQETDWRNGDRYDAETLEGDLDIAMMIAQEIENQLLSIAVTAPKTDDAPSMVLPSATERAGGYLGFNASTGDVEIVTGILPGVVTTSAFGEQVVNAASVATLLLLIGLTPTTRNTALGISALAGTTTDNVAIGYNAMDAATTGSQNVAVGVGALGALTTGANNVAVGYGAITALTTGVDNVGIGSGTLAALTTGIRNVAVGDGALTSLITGVDNVAVGAEALRDCTTSNNVAVGRFAMRVTTIGTANVAVGYNALLANTTGASNVAVGYSALLANTTGAQNIAIGHAALAANTIGQQNVAVGHGALAANTTGVSNVALGYNALVVLTTGVSNVAIGQNALAGATTGTDNVAIGYNAGLALTTGRYNVVIGALAAASAVGVLNEVTIYTGTQTIRCQSSAGAWTFSSDARDKTDIKDATIGMAFMRLISPKTYRWNNRDGTYTAKPRTLGWTAQSLDEAEATLPEPIGLVVKSDPEHWTVADTKLIPPIVNALKELDARLAKLEAA